MAESFFASLECELLVRRVFRTQVNARMEVFRYIEGWYNPRRGHSALGYLSPVRFEAAHRTALQPTLAHLAHSPPSFLPGRF
jgi:putative transposase